MSADAGNMNIMKQPISVIAQVTKIELQPGGTVETPDSDTSASVDGYVVPVQRPGCRLNKSRILI